MGRGTVMMVLSGLALVDVQERRRGIETEQRYTKNDRDRPHSPRFYMKGPDRPAPGQKPNRRVYFATTERPKSSSAVNGEVSRRSL